VCSRQSFAEKTLDELAAAVRYETAWLEHHTKRTVMHAVNRGLALIAAKTRVRAELGHGHWLPWLETQAHMSERVAQRDMRIAEAFTDKVIGPEHVDMTIGAVEAAITASYPKQGKSACQADFPQMVPWSEEDKKRIADQLNVEGLTHNFAGEIFVEGGPITAERILQPLGYEKSGKATAPMAKPPKKVQVATPAVVEKLPAGVPAPKQQTNHSDKAPPPTTAPASSRRFSSYDVSLAKDWLMTKISQSPEEEAQQKKEMYERYYASKMTTRGAYEKTMEWFLKVLGRELPPWEEYITEKQESMREEVRSVVERLHSEYQKRMEDERALDQKFSAKFPQVTNDRELIIIRAARSLMLDQPSLTEIRKHRVNQFTTIDGEQGDRAGQLPARAGASGGRNDV
jgi:DUF3102 family protein